MADKVIYATYDDEQVLLEGAKDLVSKGIYIRDVYSPFPIHGLDPVIGVKHTRIAITAFIYGLIGLSLAIYGMYFFMIQDWPMNIGGKPNFTLVDNLPAFIPIAFEFTVLLAAHGMALTYFLRNWTLPGVKARNPYPETTDDKFVMELHLHDNHDQSESELEEMLKTTGTIRIEAR
ncbi:DUF3341 domain-containing protein [Vicingaceae bacterium]|jgi:hypothetical protein|nr:DUF3341 domain-containing protein [Vicingaceae bacterium]